MRGGESVVCRPEDDQGDTNNNTSGACSCVVTQPSMICMVAYLLMPDGMTLGEWLELNLSREQLLTSKA